MLSLLLVAFSCLAHTAPTNKTSLPCVIEDTPWQITNFIAYQNTANSSVGMGMVMSNDTVYIQESFISFSFSDSNKGLELQMGCSRFTNDSLEDDEVFYPCDRRGVVFRFRGHSLEVQRAYKSKCLGYPPYDGAIAFGRADTDFVTTTTLYGTLASQTKMEMPISSIS